MQFPPPTLRQARLLWFTVCAVAVAVLVGLLGLLLWGVGQVLSVLSPVLWPLAVAGVLAYLLDPVVDYLQMRRVPRTRAIVVVFAFALAVFLGLIGSVVPAIYQESRDLVTQVPGYVDRIHEKVEGWMTNDPPRVVLRFLGPLLSRTTPATNTVSNPGDPGASATNIALLSTTDTNAPAGTPPTAQPGRQEGERLDGARGWQWLAEGSLQSATDWMARVLPNVAGWLFGRVAKVASWFGLLAGLAVIPVYLFYFLLEKRGIESGWTRYLPMTDSRFKDELVFVIRSINEYLIAFFRGQVLVAICDGVLYTIGFLLIGLPMAVLIGVMATILTIIPYLGAIVTCGSALILAAVHFGDLKHPLLVIAVFAVVQTIEGFFIQPRIVGDRVGLHPLTIIVALMVGTALFGGLLGGLLAIPMTAALRVLMFRYIWRAPEPEADSVANSATPSI